MPLKHTKAHLYTRFPKTLSDVFKAETTTTTKGDYPPRAAIIYFEVWREKRKKEKKKKSYIRSNIYTVKFTVNYGSLKATTPLS